jgi:Holliday junction resolvase RusA-like endonuclease
MTHGLTLTLSHKFPSLNEAIAAAKKHWASYYKMKKEHTGFVSDYVRLLRNMGGFPQEILDHVSLYIVFQEKVKGRLRDWDNITFAKKFILDGLVDAGVIHDDSPKHIVSITEKVFYGDEHTVTVRIET